MKKNFVYGIFALMGVFLLFSCDLLSTEAQKKQFIFYAGKEPYYFVQYNTSSEKIALQAAGYIESAEIRSVSSQLNAQKTSNSQVNFENSAINTPSRGIGLDLPEDRLLLKISGQSSRSVLDTVSKTICTTQKTSYSVGNKKDFYALYNDTDIRQETFVLKHIGENCLIWYKENDLSNIDDSSFSLLGNKFDSIYKMETDLFGSNKDYEIKYPFAFINNVEDKISIIIFNMNDPSLMGFFLNRDLFKQDSINTQYNDVKTNEIQAFYLNSVFINDSNLSDAYTTLVHEFQHMLTFINSYISKDSKPETWYTEMLSCLAEDIFTNFLELNQGYEVYSRFITYIQDSTRGFGYWNKEDTSALNASYAGNYAFGAYLFRNFGGVDFLRALTSKDSPGSNIEAINYALEKMYETGKISKQETFQSAADKFYKAFLNTECTENSNILSFNKSVTFETAGEMLTVKPININELYYSNSKNEVKCYKNGLETFSADPFESGFMYPHGFTAAYFVYESPYFSKAIFNVSLPLNEKIKFVFE